MKIGDEETVNWDYGWQFAKDILEDIQRASQKAAPYKIETQGYQVYWAGSVLRIDIKQTEFHNG